MYKWRLGWRADVLQIRGGHKTIPPDQPVVDENAREHRRFAWDHQNDGFLSVADEHVEAAWAWWREVCHSPRFVMAPMVGQSDRAFRLLCRRDGGVGLCYTPMLLAQNVNEGLHDSELGITAHSAHLNGKDESASTWPPSLDRPLICQLAGNDPQEIIRAGLRIQVSPLQKRKEK